MIFRITIVLFLLFFWPDRLLSQEYDFYFDALVKTHQISMEKDSTIYLYSGCFTKNKIQYNRYTIIIIDSNSESDYFNDSSIHVVYTVSPIELEKGKFWLYTRRFNVTIVRVEDLKNYKISINTLSMGGAAYKFRLIKKRTKKKFKTIFVEKIER
jgi:hypothetical protein